MLIVHNPKTTDFNNYGKGILDKVVLRGIFTHKINSACTITLDLIKEDITGDIMKEDIIVAPTPFGNQPFRVFDINPLGADRVEVVARHVFFDLQKRIVKRCKVDNANGQTILTKYLANLDKPVPHKLYSNITETASLDWQLKQGVDILLGDEENSFVNKLGGELRVDGFNAYIDRQIGRDRGFTARFRKNITGFTGKTTVDGLITRIIPKGFDGITLENDGYVDSTLIGNYSEIYTSVIEFPDVKYSQSPNNSNKEGFATLEEARAELIKRAKAYFEESGCDLPQSSFNINLIMLKDMVEYRDIAITEEIQLGDTITVDYTPYNLKLQKRLTGYTYNLLTQRMETLEIGDFGKDYFKELSNKIDKIEMPDFEEIKGGLEQDFQDKLEEFTDNLINGGNGSYVKFKPNFQNPSEILIMDNQDESKAKNVIRLNKEGIGASTTGVTGTYYGLAKDGKLIITEATANVIVASLIKGGILQSNDGSTWINMDDGTFSFKNKINFDGDKLSIILDDGNTIEQKITGAIETANGFTAEKVSEIKSDINGVTLKVSNVEKSLSTTNGNLSSLTERVSEAESKITESAIINTVSSAINTAKNEAINSANSSTDGKLQNYATKSSLTQTANSITAKFTSTGGSNLLKNSDAKNGQYMWSGNGATLTIGTSGANPFFGGNEFKSTFPNGLMYRESIKLKANTDYVYEGWIYCDMSFNGHGAMPLHYWCMNTPDTPGQAQLEVLDYRQDITKNVFNKCYVHFRTKSGNVYFTPFVYGGPEGQMVAVRQLSLTEGKVETAWTQHPSEIYEGSTIIDGSGVTINNGALKVKNNSGQTVLSGDSEGNLWVQNTLTVGGNNNGSVFIKNSSGTPIFSANKNGTFIKDGTMKISSGNITTSGTGYPDGNTRDMTIHSYGLDIYEVDYIGSQVAKRRANYQGGHSSLIEDNTSNATAVSYKNHQTARKISLQKTGEGDKFNTDFSTTIEMSGDNGHIRCNTIAIKSNGACNNILPGDDAYIGDVNVAHSIGIQSTSDRAQGIIYLGNRMDVYVGCDSPGGRLTLSSRWMDFIAPQGANFMGNVICRDGYEAGVTGLEGYRDGGHLRIAPANHNGAIAFEQFNSSGSAHGMRMIIDGWYLRPNGNDGGILGYSSIRWQEIWCTRGAFNGSDSKLKENITPLGVGVARPHSDDIVTPDDLYNYVKKAQAYTFNYKKTSETMLGILADEIPRNIFNKIGVMSKTQEEYEEELKKKEELTEILSKTPMPLDDKGEENLYAIVEGTGLTYAELKEEVNKEIEEPMQLINAPSQVAMLQTVLSMAINKVDMLEQENQELKDRLDKLEKLVQSIVNK